MKCVLCNQETQGKYDIMPICLDCYNTGNKDGSYKTVYIGNHWREIIGPNEKDNTLLDGLLFWYKTSLEWKQEFKVIKLPTYLDVHSYNKGH